MDAHHGDVTLETLLQHRDWVRRLSRALSRDEASADDVEQTAWMTAMKSPPRHAGNLRAWLASLVRTTARSIARGDERRVNRERVVAREPHASPHDTLERAELSRRLVEIVMTLREPYRTAVVLAYFDDLSPAEVAERTGVPATTARGRIHRGLVLVREELDRDHDGRRGAWLVALVPLAGDGTRGSIGSPATASAVLGGLVMSTKTKIAAGIVLALLVGVLLWKRDAGLESSTSAALVPQAPTLVVHAPASASAVVPRVERASIDATPGSQIAAPTASLDVTVLWDRDGSPAANVGVVLVRWDAALRRTARVTSTDAHGRARFDAVTTGTANLFVDRGVMTRLEVEPGEQKSTTLRIPDGPRVRGRVVTTQGAPAAAAQIRLSWSDRDPSSSTLAAQTDVDGRFDLGMVGEGHFVSARAPGHAPSHSREVTSVRGQAVELVLTLLGDAGRIAGHVTDAAGDPVEGANVMIGSEFPSQETFPDGTLGSAPPALPLITSADGSFGADGIALGGTQVTVRAPEFAPYTTTCDVRKGETTTLDVVLASGGTIRGTVRDAAGALAGRARIDVERHGHIAFAIERVSDDGTYAIDHLPSGRLTLRVDGDARGRALAQVEVVEGGVTEWNVVLDCEPSISGVVLDAAGAPIPGARVAARIGEDRLTAQQFEAMQAHQANANSARTDAQGRFRLCGLVDLNMQLDAYAPDAPGGLAIASLENVRAPARDLVLRANAAPASFVAGRVVDERGSPIADASLSISARPIGWSGSTTLTAKSGDDGRFRFGPMREGSYGVSVSREEFVRFDTGDFDVPSTGELDLGELTLSRGTALLVRLTSVSGSLPKDLSVHAQEWKGEHFGSFTIFGDEARSQRLENVDWVVHVTASGKVLAKELVRIGDPRELTIEVP